MRDAVVVALIGAATTLGGIAIQQYRADAAKTDLGQQCGALLTGMAVVIESQRDDLDRCMGE